MKNIRIFYVKNCHFLVVTFSVYLNRRVFVMQTQISLCMPLILSDSLQDTVSSQVMSAHAIVQEVLRLVPVSSY